MENGQKVWELLRKMKKTLECAICLDLLNDPYSSHCNHPFCRVCITTVISSNKRPNCPLCKEPISRRSVHENSRLAEIVDSVKGLEAAVMTESGIASTPPRPTPHSQYARGTPGIILHSLLHPTPRKEKVMGLPEQSSSSSDAASPRNPPPNIQRKRKRCLSTRNARRTAASSKYATRSRSKGGPSASPTLHGSNSAPCLKTRRVSHDTSSSTEKIVTTEEKCSVDATNVSQEDMEIDTPLTGPHPTGPPATGPHPTGPPATGPHPTGPPPTGPHPTGPHPTGPPPTGPHPTGPPSNGPHPTGPHPTGPPPTGPPPTEPHSSRPSPTEPHPSTPPPTEPHPSRPPPTGPRPSRPPPTGSAAIISPTVIPFTARPTTDSSASGALSSNVTVERARSHNTYDTQAAPHSMDHPSCTGATHASNSLHGSGYSSAAIKSLSSGSSTDSLSPPFAATQLAPTPGVTTTAELNTTVSPEILVPETLDPEAPTNPGWSQAVWTQVAISDTLDCVANVAETPLIAYHPCSTSVAAKVADVHCNTSLLNMQAVSQSEAIGTLSAQRHCESILRPASQPQPPDCIPDTLATEPSQGVPSNTTHQYQFHSPAIPLQSYTVCASQALSQFGRTLRSSFRRKRKILQAVEEEMEEESIDFRPVVGATPPKLSDNGEADFHPPAVVLPGLQMPSSPCLPSLPKPKALKLNQQREERNVPVDQPTPPWLSQDPPTPPGGPLDTPTPPGIPLDPPTPPGVPLDPPTPPGVPLDQPTPPGVPQDPPISPRVPQDPPIPPGMPHGSGSGNTLSPVTYTDVKHLGSATSDEPQKPVHDSTPASPVVVPVKAEDTPPRHCTEPLPRGEASPSSVSSPTTNSSLNELSFCTMAESIDTQALAALQWTLHEKQKEIEELDDILKKADINIEEGQEDSAVMDVQQSALPVNGEEWDSLSRPDGRQVSTHSTHVPKEERSSMLAPGGEDSSLLLIEGEAGSGSVGGNGTSPQVVAVDLQDALDQLLGGDATDDQDGRLVGMTGLEDEEIAEQTDTDHPGSHVPGTERVEKENLHKVAAAKDHVAIQPSQEDCGGVSTDVTTIPASLHTPTCDAEGRVVTASQSIEAHISATPFSPDQEDVHVVLDSLPIAAQKGCGDSSVVQTSPTMSAPNTGGERREGGGVQVSMAVDSSVGDAEMEQEMDNLCSGSSHQPRGDVARFREEIGEDEVCPVSSPSLLEWRESLSQGTCKLLQESRQLIQDIKASRARSLTPRTGGTPTCAETTLNIEGQSMLAIVQNLETFITGGIKQGLGGPLPLPAQVGPYPLPTQGGPHPLPAQGGPLPLPAQGGPLPLPTQEGPHLLPTQEGPHPLPAQGGPHPLPTQVGPHLLPTQEGPHPLPAQGGPHPLPTQVGPRPPPVQGGPRPLPTQEGPRPLPAQEGPHPPSTPLTSGSSGAYLQEGGGGKVAASESLPAARRRTVHTVAGWQSARRNSKLHFGPSAKTIDVWTPGGIREESKTRPKRKSLPEFWQPTSDKKKKLDFLVAHSSVSATSPSVSNSTTTHSHGDHPPYGCVTAPSVPPAPHERRTSLSNTGEPRTEDQLGKHGPVGKSSPRVPGSPVLGRQYSLVASGLRKTQMQSLKEFVRQFDLRLASTFNQCTTHVVIATDENRQCPRTVKYLQGVAGGRWIVSFDWVSQSLHLGRLLPEDVFEVTSDSVTSVLGVPRIARTHHNGTGLFQGCAVVLCGEFKEMTRDQIAQLLKLSGAQLISKGEIPSISSKLSLVISDVVCSPQGGEQVHSNWDVVSSDWVVDSLSSFRVLPLDGHLLQLRAT